MDSTLAFEVNSLSQRRHLDQLIERGDSEVQRFYEDAVIFLTGGSGFLGKQLIEKLLRSCKIKKIYMLLRPKYQQAVKERLAAFGKDPVFENLMKKQPNFLEKIVPVQGDVQELRLGLSDEDWSAITEEVNIIYHGAATVNFVEPLKVAVLINVRGTIQMLNLGKACKNLRAFVHISTAYSYATKSRIGKSVLEEFYPCPVPPEAMIKFAEHMDSKKLDDITPQLIEGWPNTYAFTKSIAEEAVRTMAGDLPICIVRPAIVIASHREPSPGWIDKSNILGPSGIIFGLCLGVLHTVLCNTNTKIGLVPVDFVNNGFILAAHETAARRKRNETETKIYAITSARNAITFGLMQSILEQDSYSLASNKAVWYAFGYLTKNKLWFWILTWVFHYIPGYLADFILLIMGKPQMAVKQYEKGYKLNSVLAYFMCDEWLFGDTNLLDLYQHQSPADKAIYQCDIAVLDWKEYICMWAIGIRKYIIKDGLKDSKKGVMKQKWLRVAHYIFVAFYIYAVWTLLYLIYSFVTMAATMVW